MIGFLTDLEDIETDLRVGSLFSDVEPPESLLLWVPDSYEPPAPPAFGFARALEDS